MLLSVPLKSKRVASSRWAWSTALRTSCTSTSETTSKLGIAVLDSSRPIAETSTARLRRRGRYPSGQRGRAVNPLRYRYVRIHPAHHPSPAHRLDRRARARASAASARRRASGRTCGRPRARCRSARSRTSRAARSTRRGPPTMRAMTEWKPWSSASPTSSPSRSSPMPRPRPSRCTYTESSTVGAYAGRGRNGDSDAKPSTVSASSTATIAGMPARVLGEPRHLVVERAGHEIEGDGGLERPRGCRSPGSPRRRARCGRRSRLRHVADARRTAARGRER